MKLIFTRLFALFPGYRDVSRSKRVKEVPNILRRMDAMQTQLRKQDFKTDKPVSPGNIPLMKRVIRILTALVSLTIAHLAWAQTPPATALLMSSLYTDGSGNTTTRISEYDASNGVLVNPNFLTMKQGSVVMAQSGNDLFIVNSSQTSLKFPV